MSFALKSDNPPIQLAATKNKTLSHKVHAGNCERTRRAIMQRCQFKYKMGKDFCKKQDEKNAATCEDLRQRTESHKNNNTQKNLPAKRETQNKPLSNDPFNNCIRMSGCNYKQSDSAKKWCYSQCRKHRADNP